MDDGGALVGAVGCEPKVWGAAVEGVKHKQSVGASEGATVGISLLFVPLAAWTRFVV